MNVPFLPNSAIDEMIEFSETREFEQLQGDVEKLGIVLAELRSCVGGLFGQDLRELAEVAQSRDPYAKDPGELFELRISSGLAKRLLHAMARHPACVGE